jgi:hypothetical protein
MSPEPQVAASDAEVARPTNTAPQRRLRRWPLIGMLAFAIGASVALWAGIFALIGAIGVLVN